MSASKEIISDQAKELVGLKELLSQLSNERDQYKRLYELSREEIARLKQGLLAQKSERMPKNAQQLSLGILEELLGRLDDQENDDEKPVAKQEVQSYKRKKPGRKPLPENLPLVRIEVLPEDVRQKGLNAFDKIGEECSWQIERRPQSLVRVQTVRPKFVPKGRKKESATHISIADVPELPIAKGLAGPGFLADTIVKRWDDHLPLNRQEKIYQREGLELSRSTICGWHDKLSQLCQLLIESMFADAYRQPYLCTDATGVLVLAKEKCRHGHFWVLVAPQRHVLFRFSNRHNSKAVDALLPGYKGYLVADAHIVYDHLYLDGDIIEVGCWCHARRYFFKALESDPDRAQYALSLIARLFRIERGIANSSRKKKETIRRKKSNPLVEQLLSWCRAEQLKVLEDTPIEKAFGYCINQQEALSRYLDDGRLPIDNNISERELRREAVGRKNWLFVGSANGAAVNATFVSLLASCRMHHLNPWTYLRDLFCLIPKWPEEKILELAPVNWRQTIGLEETQKILDANIYRKITLPEWSPDPPST